MRLVPLLALASLSFAASAQSPAPQASAQAATATVTLQSASGAGCPVGFEARHAGGGDLVNVAPAAAQRREHGYRITLAPHNEHSITQARITLRGVAGPHVMQAGHATQAGADATESVNFAPAAADKGLFRATVTTSKLTGVQWVELNELSYADGTSWHASAATPCRVAPNGFMLVAAGK